MSVSTSSRLSTLASDDSVACPIAALWALTWPRASAYRRWVSFRRAIRRTTTVSQVASDERPRKLLSVAIRRSTKAAKMSAQRSSSSSRDSFRLWACAVWRITCTTKPAYRSTNVDQAPSLRVSRSLMSLRSVSDSGIWTTLISWRRMETALVIRRASGLIGSNRSAGLKY